MAETPAFKPQAHLLAPAPMLGQRVTDELRRMIVSGEIPAETHLVEAQLSEMFGLSRAPIRDALRQLETEGLVESRRGVFVKGLVPDDIGELSDLREALELKVMELCNRLEDPDLTEITGHLNRMRQAADSLDGLAFSRADLDFHSAFYVLAGNRRILDVWNQFRPTYEMLIHVANVEPIDLERIFAEHEDLLELTFHGNIADLSAALHTHLLQSKDRLLAGYSKLHKHS